MKFEAKVEFEAQLILQNDLMGRHLMGKTRDHTLLGFLRQVLRHLHLEEKQKYNLQFFSTDNKMK